VGDVVHLPRALAWIADLQLSGWEAQLVAEALAGLPKRIRMRTYRYLALRLRILQELVVSDDVRRDLGPIIDRCGLVLAQNFVVTGAALVARQPRDEATVIALRKLTRDARVLERLGLSSDVQAQP
jgi:hypothetical protein